MDTCKKILIVDDMEMNRIILQEILSGDYEIECASDGTEAISNLINSVVKPNLVLLDIMMPNVDGFEVMKFIKSDDTLSKIPVIFITASDQEADGLKAGAVDYISKPFDSQLVKLRVANQIELSLYRNELEDMVEEKSNELLTVRDSFLHTIADLIEYRSFESGQHVKRTKELARILIAQMLDSGIYFKELKEQNIKLILGAVPLHDIGKIGILDSILLKPGKLTSEEFESIKTHVTLGSEIIMSLKATISNSDDYLQHCYDICRFHHERWDGNGYPDKLAGEAIPLSARIVAVVDVYDALTSERCYKKAVLHEIAIDIIKQGAGTQFDPKIVDALILAEKNLKSFV